MKKLILSHLKKAISIILTAILLLSTISFEVFAEDPKISIIIPVYNTPENLLRDCLESAKNQTLKDIEIICVDDGSTNGSGKILDEYAKSDPKFVVVHQKNGGTAVARDKGMDLAKREYIQFLDHDDIIDPTMSEKCYNAAKEYDADVVKCRTCGDNDCGNFRGVIAKFKPYIGPIYTYVWDGIYKKSYLDHYNIRFYGMVPCWEDVMFNLMTIMEGHRLVFLDQNFYTHVNHPGNYCEFAARNNKLGFALRHNILRLYEFVKNQHPGSLEYYSFFLKSALNLGVDLGWLQSIDSELLSDDVINKLPIAEGIRLKSMMLIANSKTKPQKTLDNGIYTISSKLDSNKCLAIKGGSKNNCANLQLLDRNGTDAQKFKIQYNPDGCYTIKAMCSGKMLDMLGGSKNILQCTKNKRNTQKWFIVPDGEGYYCFVSKSNNLCMSVDDANVCCSGVHGGDNQRFKLEKCQDTPSKAKKDAVKPNSSKPIDSKKSV